MRSLLLLVVSLGATGAVPFFPRELLNPESILVTEAEDPIRYDAPAGHVSQFVFQLPRIDLSQIFRPFRVFAGLNGPPAARPAFVQPECETGTFDVTDEEHEVVVGCQGSSSGDDVLLKEVSLLPVEEGGSGDDALLKECILQGLPATSVELAEFLDKEEFGVSSISSSYSLSLVNGQATRKQSVSFSLCTRDELNSIDGSEGAFSAPFVPTVDRFDTLGTDGGATLQPSAQLQPMFQFQVPQFQLPDFSTIFSPFFAATVGGESEQSPGLFSNIFGAVEAPPQPNVDSTDCVADTFEVSGDVYNLARTCQYNNDFRMCLRNRLDGDADGADLFEFAAHPDYEVVSSGFSKAVSFINFKLNTKNRINMKMCRTIEDNSAGAAVLPEVVSAGAHDSPVVPFDENPETGETIAEEVPIAPEEVSDDSESVGEEIPVVPETIPSEEYATEQEDPVVPEISPEESPEAAAEEDRAAQEAPEEDSEVFPEAAPVNPSNDSDRSQEETLKSLTPLDTDEEPNPSYDAIEP